MRWKTTLVGAGLVLIAGTACANPAADSPKPAAGQQPGNSAPAAPPSEEPQPAPPLPRGPGHPVDPGRPGPPPAEGQQPVPPGQLNTSALPEGYPHEASVSSDGKTLLIKAQEGGCGRASAEPKEQSGQQVVVNLVETTAQTSQMCTMDIRYPTVSVQLGEPLGDRTVVLHSEQRKK
ncbi:hypothetical protein [Amycolatopsis anabasis]|uniref:hypothetical protein n=1 Tax=Amycolatopsis anabasis TaxID=1840409 RepID=UPI00131DA172|nr:hypothetical protein [Amycolatopsis anabasis]